jgi:hypothetical protein
MTGGRRRRRSQPGSGSRTRVDSQQTPGLQGWHGMRKHPQPASAGSSRWSCATPCRPGSRARYMALADAINWPRRSGREKR